MKTFIIDQQFSTDEDHLILNKKQQSDENNSFMDEQSNFEDMNYIPSFSK